MTKNPVSELDQAKRIMGALVRMPPKPHEKMKLGKARRIKHTAKKKAPPKRGQ
jgi:hypothetical protein